MKQPRKKSSSYQNKLTSDQFKFLLQNEVKIYPVSLYDEEGKRLGWFIEVSVYGDKKTFNKQVKQDDIQEAIDKTQLYYYDKLKSTND